MNTISKLVLFLLFSFCFHNSIGQNTLEVPSQYSTIQEALDAASENDRIEVSPGTYVENLLWPEEINGIKLIGVEGSEQTIIEGSTIGPCLVLDNSDGNIIIDNLTEIRGFTVQNGWNGNGTLTAGPAGISIRNGSPTLRDLVVRDNEILESSTAGVGMLLTGFKGEIKDCHFYNNYSNSAGEGLGVRNHGTGLYITNSDSVKLTNCSFKNNMTDGADWAYGAGLYFQSIDSSAVYLSNCLFEENTSLARLNADGGAATFKGKDLRVYIDSCSFIKNTAIDSSEQRISSGGAIDFSERGAEVHISNSQFIENKADKGSALSLDQVSASFLNSLELTNSIFQLNETSAADLSLAVTIYCGNKLESLKVDNCVIDHNFGPSFYLSNFTLPLLDCQFYNSTLAYNLGGIQHQEINMFMRNCILHNPDYPEFEEISSSSDESEFDLSFSVIEGGLTGAQFEMQEQVYSSDPLFIDEFILIPSSLSPAVETGNLTFTTDFDFAGVPRPLPAGTNPDIGAYETDGNPSYVLSQFFVDENENMVKDFNESFTTLGGVIVNGTTTMRNFREEGIIFIPGLENINIQFDSSSADDWNVTTQSSYDYDFTVDRFRDTILFGMVPDTSFRKVRTYIACDPMRCGEWVDLVIAVANEGTQSVSGGINLVSDERIETFEYIDFPSITDENISTWNLNNLAPGVTRYYSLRFLAPLIMDASQIGEIYEFISTHDFDEEDSRFTHLAELRCAYDPNDKLVHPQRPDDLSLIEKEMQYTIRFQNTGNDYAKDVRIIDTIDTALDLETFRLINTSHPDVLNFTIEDRIINFNFENIFLPDSTTNFDESNGFIQFKIQPHPDVAENTIVNNTAYIIFDFNPAIITNTTRNILVEEFPTASTYFEGQSTIEFFPNPTSGTVNFSETIEELKIYNANGKLLIRLKDVSEVDLSALQDGPYFLVFQENGIQLSKKIVLSKERE